MAYIGSELVVFGEACCGRGGVWGALGSVFRQRKRTG